MKTIRFKSTPENWKKEYLGLKCNTVRKKGINIEGDIRFEILDSYLYNKISSIRIEIENINDNEIFEREVTDVTKWDDYYIISWRNE